LIDLIQPDGIEKELKIIKDFWKLFTKFTIFMKQEKIYKLMDLIDDIKKVNDMIEIHSSNPSSFMLDQYKAKKEKLMSYLIDELVEPSVRSPKSFSIILKLLSKFYPDLLNEAELDESHKELTQLEVALAS
jgi:hypothetical protein